MTKRAEFIKKFQLINKHHLDMLEKHRQIIDKYAVPYLVPGEDNWGLRYEKIMERKKQREDFGKEIEISDKEKLEENKLAVVVTAPTMGTNSLDANVKTADLPNNTDVKPELVGVWAHFKFFDY